MAKRKVIKIDEDKCNGCGLCVYSCHEGAIQVIDGKARLVSETYCDGLGACLGHCPQDAITIEEREAEAFTGPATAQHHHHEGACPGSKVMNFAKKAKSSAGAVHNNAESELGNWPIQINLVPPHALYLNGADLLISADCVPFAYPGFHSELLEGKVLLVGCPKLDDINKYSEKITAMFKDSDIKSVTYAHMEVPCCFGLIGVIGEAIAASGKNIPFTEVMIGIKGQLIKSGPSPY